VRADTPPALAGLVSQCLEKEADRRPQQARDVLRALEGITSGSSTAMPVALVGRETSVVRAVLLWGVAFGATYILARAAIVGIGLPDWVLPGSLIVAGLGLPAVLATYWVQRTARRVAIATPTVTPGGTVVPPSTIGTIALKASPHLTWTRTWRAGALAAAAFVLTVAAYMIMRVLGIGPAASLQARGIIEKDGRVVLAQFATRGTDSSIASALTEALRADLSQSRAFSLLPPSAIRNTLALMQRPAETPLDAAVAREVAQREGAKVVVAADVAALGTGFLVTAQLLQPGNGDPLATITEQAKGADELMAAIGRVSRQIRSRIGESLKTLQNAQPLERVSTSSLEAFRKYDEAIRLTEGAGADEIKGQRGDALLREAVAIDTTFAMAYRKLGWLETDPVKKQEFLAKAWRYRDRLSPVERYQAEGLYYWLAEADVDRAIEAHLEAFRIDSTIPRLAGNLAQLYYLKRQFDTSLAWARRVAYADSIQVDSYTWPAFVSTQRFGEMDSVISREQRRAGRVSPLGLIFAITQAWAREQWDSVAALARSMRASSEPIGGYADFLEGSLRELRGQRGDRSWIPAPYRPLATAFMDGLIGDVSVSAAILDSAVNRLRIDTLALELRVGYLGAAMTYAVAGQPAGAKRLIAKYDAEVRDTLQRKRQRMYYGDVSGWIALREDRPDEAISHFRRALDNGLHDCSQCLLAGLGLAFEKSGALDSAIASFERAVNETQAFYYPMQAAPFYPLSYRRLGDLYEQRGDTGKAVTYYTKFVNIWAKADPELQPKVAEVRAHLKRLAQTERR
jgi:tetratricopeptide (TPR) repeat protein